jgi:hypothetical protein
MQITPETFVTTLTPIAALFDTTKRNLGQGSESLVDTHGSCFDLAGYP